MKVKKIAVVSDHTKEVVDQLKKIDNIKLVKAKPDFVISYGGDGMLMRAEFQFPGVPKLFLKKSRVAKLAQHDDVLLILEKFVTDKFSIQNHQKLVAVSGRQKVLGLNDIVIHNADPRHAIRYQVKIDSISLGHEIIGDGVVIATALGSTGYYRSITDSYFESGIGLAFNNSTEQSDHVVLRPNRVIEVEITRGPAECYADNQPKSIKLKMGDRVTIKMAPQQAKLVKIKI